jgi:hypothetical protein
MRVRSSTPQLFPHRKTAHAGSMGWAVGARLTPQSSKRVPPSTSESVSSGHSSQKRSPVVFLYVPAGHAEHAAPSSALSYPSMQVQLAASVDPFPDVVPPIPQVVQAPLPALPLYVPMGQTSQELLLPV